MVLDQWLAAEPRSWREILDVFIDVAQALGTAHEKNVVYREVRIEHIVVGPNGHAHLHGVEPAVAEPPKELPLPGMRTAAVSLKQRIAKMQTTEEAAYLAPEQIRGWVPDARSNQFSYCVGLYRALYKQPPFDHDWAASEAGDTPSRVYTPLGSISFGLILQSFDRTTLIDLARQILSGNLRPPPSDTDVPVWLELIIRRGLRPDPDERYASMKDLLNDMAPQIGDTPRGRSLRRGHLSRKVVVAGGFCLLALAILGLLIYLRP